MKMKLLVAAIILSLLLSGILMAVGGEDSEEEDKVEVPEWNEGDRWRYKESIPMPEMPDFETEFEKEVTDENSKVNFNWSDEDEKTYETYQVKETINPDDPEEKTEIDFYHWKENLAEIYNDHEDSLSSAYHPPIVELDFPLYVGKEWEGEARYFEDPGDSEKEPEPDKNFAFWGTVENRMSVDTGVGEFEDTYMVNLTVLQYVEEDGHEVLEELRRFEIYYSSEVKNIVHQDNYDIREVPDDYEGPGEDEDFNEDWVGNETLIDYDLETIEEDDGTEIHDWYDLDNVRDDLDGDYILMNDLDEDTDGYEELVDTEDGWEPIGKSDPDDDVEFNGYFNGKGQEIRDLFINRPNEDDVGLFGNTDDGAEITDVGVVDAEVTGDWSVGVLVGTNRGDIFDSYATGDVVGDKWVGGLLGYHLGENITVSNSYTRVEVTGNEAVGGLVGQNHEMIENSYATGEANGDSGVGGLIGVLYGMVEDSYAAIPVNGEDYVGGLIGHNLGTVSNSFWDTEISGIEESDGGTGLPTDEMIIEETFTDAGWDFEEGWDIIENETYPFLQWQGEDTYPYFEKFEDEEDDDTPGFTLAFLILATLIVMAIYRKKER